MHPLQRSFLRALVGVARARGRGDRVCGQRPPPPPTPPPPSPARRSRWRSSPAPPRCSRASRRCSSPAVRPDRRADRHAGGRVQPRLARLVDPVPARGGLREAANGIEVSDATCEDHFQELRAKRRRRRAGDRAHGERRRGRRRARAHPAVAPAGRRRKRDHRRNALSEERAAAAVRELDRAVHDPARRPHPGRFRGEGRGRLPIR